MKLVDHINNIFRKMPPHIAGMKKTRVCRRRNGKENSHEYHETFSRVSSVAWSPNLWKLETTSANFKYLELEERLREIKTYSARRKKGTRRCDYTLQP